MLSYDEERYITCVKRRLACFKPRDSKNSFLIEFLRIAVFAIYKGVNIKWPQYFFVFVHHLQQAIQSTQTL